VIRFSRALRALPLVFVFQTASAAPLRAADVVRRIEEANPEIAEARERTLASSARARGQGRLPDPTVGVQLWNAPASNPVAAGEAEMVMYGIEQNLSLPPKLRLQRSADAALAGATGEERRRIGNRVRLDALRAFHEYWRATQELSVHAEHLEIAKQVRATAESQYGAGRARQHDVLRATGDLAKLHADVSTIRQEVATASAVLRALMALPGEEELGVPTIEAALADVPELVALEKRLPETRPEIRAAGRAEESAAVSLRLARLDVWVPDVMVGLTWMDMREGDDGWMPMIRVNVPLVSRGRWDARSAARHDLLAARFGRSAVTNAALAELRDAHARSTGARDVLDRYTKEILPVFEASLESARAAYVGGNGDFLDLLDASRSLLDARLSKDRARARYESALADLEYALGEPLSEDSEGGR